jgi:cysteinyl-tRNA synthetase
MLTFYNTLSRKKETLKSSKGAIVKIYICGPTVYDFAHLGNLRAYLFSDILIRYLNFYGYKTRSVMNITDVDDKTIAGAKKAKISLKEYTKKYEKAFFEDLDKLNIQRANIYPRATENIKEIQDLILDLYKKGYAYEKDGSVYFDISKFKNYGCLSKINLKGLKNGARVDLDQYEKESPSDFVLWKKAKPNEPFWNLKLPITYNLKPKTLFGRPGWHIECSAMAMKYLGKTLDFHLGGVDLIFPHHENEIAQSEAATGKKFAKFWLHNEHLLVSGQKMAKSLGNYYTLRDLISRGFDPLAFRYLCLQSHYRSKMNFTWESLKAAAITLKDLQTLGQRQSNQNYNTIEYWSICSKIENKIIKALDDDLDTPRALAILHKANNFGLWLKFDEVLGLNLKSQISKLKITAQISKLLKEREKLRKQGKFKEADEIRKKIKEMGYEIEDTEKGPRLVVCSRP